MTIDQRLSRPAFDYLWLLLLCLPLLWLNVGPSHDWGGDFAQYLQQAENIVEGRAQTETGYVYNPSYPMLGPRAYPAGYPLLLAPVHALAGKYILPFIRYQSALLILFALLMYAFFRMDFSRIASILLVLVVVYNPWTLNFKRELMSDIPFALFLLAAVLLYERKLPAAAGLAAGFAIAIRSIGWAWAGALLPLLFLAMMRPQKEKKPWLSPLLALGLASALPLLLNSLIFQIPSGFDLYRNNLSGENLGKTIFENLAYYVDVLQWFFQVPAREGRFLTLATKAVIFALILVGGINRWLERPRLIDWLILAYLGILLLYPYRAGGFRFLFPLLPFLLVYAVTGFEAIRWRRSLPARWRPLILGALLLLPYAEGISRIVKRQDRMVQGPQLPEAAEAFAAVTRLVPETGVVLFARPRVLAYYADRKSTALGREQAEPEAWGWLEACRADFALWHDAEKDPALEKLLAAPDHAFEEIWRNSRFILYHRNPQSILLPE